MHTVEVRLDSEEREAIMNAMHAVVDSESDHTEITAARKVMMAVKRSRRSLLRCQS